MLTRSILVLSLFSLSCLAPQYGVRHTSDEACGSVRGVDVRLRDGVRAWPEAADCRSALDAVGAQDLSHLGGWGVIVTRGPAGYALDRDGLLQPAQGMCYQAARVIEVNAFHLGLLSHEVGHALDGEIGHPNDRDWASSWWVTPH